MKPAATTKKNRHQHPQHSPAIFSALPGRVKVEFLPHFGWQVDIGQTPTKAFAAPQTMRDNASETGYKPANGRSPSRAFPTVGLMMDAEKQVAIPRYIVYRATPKLPVNH
jgi:hypothetical protein